MRMLHEFNSYSTLDVCVLKIYVHSRCVCTVDVCTLDVCVSRANPAHTCQILGNVGVRCVCYTNTTHVLL